MSTGEVRKVSREDIQLVQNLIERCLQLYMSQKEVVDTLLVQAKIEPGFTELVWQKLEEENREFFKAYHLRLMVKDQIMQFNQLLERQVELMHISTGVASTPISNGSHIPPLHQNSAGYALDHTGPGLKSETMGHPMGSSLPNVYNNGIGGSSLHPCMQNTVDMLAHSRRIDVSPSMMLAHGSNVGMMQGMNGGLIKSESGCYGGNSRYMFDNGGDVLETRPAIGNPSVSPFSSVDSNSHPQNESLLDADGTSFGLLQIPRNFSLSDLTAHFSNGSDNILMDYSGPAFLAGDSGNFLDPHGRGEYQGDNKRLDTISEGLSYEDFGSD